MRGKEQEADSAPSRSRSSRHPLSSLPNDDDEMDDGTAAGHAETNPQSNCLTDEGKSRQSRPLLLSCR